MSGAGGGADNVLVGFSLRLKGLQALSPALGVHELLPGGLCQGISKANLGTLASTCKTFLGGCPGI